MQNNPIFDSFRFKMYCIKRILPVVLLTLVLLGCETEVDLFTEHKERVVLYALLDPGKDVQYFRVNPTFIGEGDAREVAGDPTNTNYDANEVLVQLVDVTSDKTYTCLETTSIPLDIDGIFSTQNRLYYLNTPTSLDGNNLLNDVLLPDHTYRVVVTNQLTGEVTTAETISADYNNIKLNVPNTSSLSTSVKWIEFYTGLAYRTYSFVVSRTDNIKRFNLMMRYYYTEQGEDPNSTLKDKYVDIDLGEVRPDEVTGGTVLIDYYGEKFYSILQQKLAGKTNLVGQRADIFVTAMGKEIDAYISVQGSTQGSISQDLTEYSNVEGGLGIFSFKSTKVFQDILINNTTARHLIEGNYTIPIFDCARYGSQSDSRGVLDCK